MTTLAHAARSTREATRSLWPFYAGAAADTVVGTDLIVFSSTIARLLLPAHETVAGIPTESIMLLLGVFLLLFAAATILAARAHGPLVRFRAWIVAANGATVALALMLSILAFNAFSPIGIGALLLLAVALGTLTALQRRAL